MVVDGSGSQGCELALVKRQAGHGGVRRRAKSAMVMHCNAQLPHGFLAERARPWCAGHEAQARLSRGWQAGTHGGSTPGLSSCTLIAALQGRGRQVLAAAHSLSQPMPSAPG